jgi:hypothetical protein
MKKMTTNREQTSLLDLPRCEGSKNKVLMKEMNGFFRLQTIDFRLQMIALSV